MALIDRIKYDGSPDRLVWKYPKENIVLGSQLIVNESQETVFFKGGQALDVFGPGTHTLSTKNLPLLEKLVNLPFGGETPFAAEIYYINRVSRLDYKWGTRTPIPVEDPKYRVLVPIGCFGQFGLRVADSRLFVTQIVGTMPEWKGDMVLEYFRGVILTRVKDIVAKYVVDRNLSIAVITARIDEISQLVEERLRDEFAKYGLELLKFFITSITIPAEELRKIQEIDLKAREIDRLGDQRYQMMRGFDVMEEAAKNPGAPGTLMGAGIGLGIGAKMAGPFSNMAEQATQTVTRTPSNTLSGVICPKCQANAPAGSQFCIQCGANLTAVSLCPSCQQTLAANSKFCPHCGTKIPSATNCPSCGAQIPENAKFCPECGKSL